MSSATLKRIVSILRKQRKSFHKTVYLQRTWKPSKSVKHIRSIGAQIKVLSVASTRQSVQF